MSNVNVRGVSKGMIIALVIAVLLLGSGGAYLLWRVNQQKTVAPTDSDASEQECTQRCTSPCVQRYTVEPGKTWDDYMGCSEYPGCQGGAENHCYCLYSKTCNITAYHITYVAGSNGSVTKSGQNSIAPGGSISSTATPNSGYRFTKWSDNNTAATRTDSNIQADATYTANFELIPIENFTLRYLAGTGGTVTGVTTQTVEKGKNATEVTAVPNTNYKFVKWDDSKTTASRTDTNVQSSKTFTAEFRISCGDNICDAWEDVTNCPGDCKGCGDGQCVAPENANACAVDCPVTCGDNICSPSENSQTCLRDCPASCGDDICTADENASTCPADCRAVCGDGMCTTGENSATCPTDCGGVPNTGIFDNSKHTMIFGAVVLAIGLAWTWVSTLPKKAYILVSNTSKNVSRYVGDVKEKKEKSVRESRRSRLERRIK